MDTYFKPKTLHTLIIKYLLGEICGSCSDKVIILTPFPGWNEIDPEDLWNKIVKVRNIYDCQGGKRHWTLNFTVT